MSVADMDFGDWWALVSCVSFVGLALFGLWCIYTEPKP